MVVFVGGVLDMFSVYVINLDGSFIWIDIEFDGLGMSENYLNGNLLWSILVFESFIDSFGNMFVIVGGLENGVLFWILNGSG